MCSPVVTGLMGAFIGGSIGSGIGEDASNGSEESSG